MASIPHLKALGFHVGDVYNVPPVTTLVEVAAASWLYGASWYLEVESMSLWMVSELSGVNLIQI